MLDKQSGRFWFAQGNLSSAQLVEAPVLQTFKNIKRQSLADGQGSFPVFHMHFCQQVQSIFPNDIAFLSFHDSSYK